MKAASSAPTAKVAAGGIAGAIAVILIAILPKFGIKQPPEFASALATLIVAGAAAYQKEERLRDFELTDEQIQRLIAMRESKEDQR